MSLVVRVGGIELRGDDPHAVGWHINADGWRGWNDGARVVRQNTSRVRAPGEFDVPGFSEARVVDIEGYVIATSEEDLAHRNAQFGSLHAREPLALYVNEMGTDRFARGGRVDGSYEFNVWGGQRFADYSISLWFADPRKYGERRIIDSAVPVFQYGNCPAAPVLTVEGSMPAGYTVNGPAGRSYTVTAPAVPGQPHVIDMATGLLKVGGAAVYGAVTAADTWAIPAGQSVTNTLVPVSGSGSLTTTVTDTYI